jgi:predicted oxidoreductase
MERIRLNDSVSLSRIIQGFWHITDWKRTPQENLDFVYECLKLGVTSFDIAEIYGDYEAESVFGEVLKLDPALRSKIEIITKTGINMASSKRPYTIGHYDTSYDRIVASCKTSLKKMNTTYIDVFLIHREDPLIDHEEVARALEDLTDQGLIKSYGVSNFDPFKFEALQAATGNQLVTNQIEWNPLVFEHVNNGNLDVLQKHHVAPMIWSPLAQGQLFNPNKPKALKVAEVLTALAKKYETAPETVAFAYLLKHPVKAMPISGSSKTSRLKHAVDALDLNLEREDWYKIYVASGDKWLR